MPTVTVAKAGLKLVRKWALWEAGKLLGGGL